MYANRSEMAGALRQASNVRFCAAEGIYKAKAKPGFDSESPAISDLFAYICTYLRTFALKNLLLHFAERRERLPNQHHACQRPQTRRLICKRGPPKFNNRHMRKPV